MVRPFILMAGLVMPGLLYAAPALAAENPAPGEHPGQDASLADGLLPQPDFGPTAQAASPFAGSAVADDAMLADVTGMADIKVLEQSTNVRNTSTVSGNIINGDPTTGIISIDGGSFGNFNGLALINANTGNNVSINAAMNVNVGIQ